MRLPVHISRWCYYIQALVFNSFLGESEVHLGRCITSPQITRGLLNKQQEDGSILNKIYWPRMNAPP